jgi:hypothetical protein
MEPSTLELTTTIERHDPGLPRYVVVPGSAVRPWNLDGTTVVEGTIDDTPLGRRSLKRWDAERWFLDLPDSLCRKAGVDTGDTVTLELRPAPTDLPEELTGLLTSSAEARQRWERMTPSRRRMLREHVLAAKRPETRRRRAHKALGVDD